MEFAGEKIKHTEIEREVEITEKKMLQALAVMQQDQP